jgi:hypothetical protein
MTDSGTGLVIKKHRLELLYIAISAILFLTACKSKKNQTGLTGRWRVASMGPAHELRVPKGTKITYIFKANDKLTIETPFKNANRIYTKIDKNRLKFDGQGLFGGYKTFEYTVTPDSLTLQTDRGFIIKFYRVKG